MATTEWSLQRGYASLIHPSKGMAPPPQPVTYALKLESEFRQALTAATNGATRQPMSAVVFKMTDDREHPVRDSLMKIAFGQTRTPLPAMVDLASRLACCTDHRTGSSLLITTLEEAGDRRRVSLFVFPEEESYTLRNTALDPTEAILERLQSFVLQSRLRKVARFEGKNINSHFIKGEVADLQIGANPRAAADYWIIAFLDAEFAITSDKGTRLVAAGLKLAFERAEMNEKQAVMEAATALMASRRQAWSLEKIARTLIPSDLIEVFCSVAPNTLARNDQFMLSKDLLRDRINYRVFQLETGVWVSAPFSEVGATVKLTDSGGKTTLTARGVVINEKVQRDATRRRRD